MRTMRRRLGLVGMGITLVMAPGCQTWEMGMTLPSPHYLEGHFPQYFPEEPAFPLPKELASQEAAAGLLKPAPPRGANPVVDPLP